jgi:hypothetical protein
VHASEVGHLADVSVFARAGVLMPLTLNVRFAKANGLDIKGALQRTRSNLRQNLEPTDTRK